MSNINSKEEVMAAAERLRTSLSIMVDMRYIGHFNISFMTLSYMIDDKPITDEFLQVLIYNVEYQIFDLKLVKGVSTTPNHTFRLDLNPIAIDAFGVGLSGLFTVSGKYNEQFSDFGEKAFALSEMKKQLSDAV